MHHALNELLGAAVFLNRSLIIYDIDAPHISFSLKILDQLLGFQQFSGYFLL